MEIYLSDLEYSTGPGGTKLLFLPHVDEFCFSRNSSVINFLLLLISNMFSMLNTLHCIEQSDPLLSGALWPEMGGKWR